MCILGKTVCRYSSVVEHVIGNDGVVSPILTIGTNKKSPLLCGLFYWYYSLEYDFIPVIDDKCSCASLVAAQLKEHGRVVLMRNARRLRPSKESKSNRSEALQTSGVVSPIVQFLKATVFHQLSDLIF